MRLEGLGKLRTFSDLVENLTHYLLACSRMPQQSTLPRAHIVIPFNFLSANMVFPSFLRSELLIFHMVLLGVTVSECGKIDVFYGKRNFV
jgi:hypothetical protein